MQPRSLFLWALRRPSFWFVAALALVPPDAIASTLHWDIVDPGYLALMILWWPIDISARLWILTRLLDRNARPAARQDRLRAVGAALNSEAFLGLKLGIVALLGLFPALICLAALGINAAWKIWLVVVLVLGGLLPSLTYFLRRALAPVGILLYGQEGIEALDWSAAQLRQRLGAFAKLALPWWILSGILNGMTLGLGDLGPGAELFSWCLGILALIATLIPLALFQPKNSAF